MYTLWYGHVAQKGVSPAGHPIVEERRKMRDGLRVNVSYACPMGPGPPVLTLLIGVAMMRRVVFPVPNLRWE